ncbi:hypothetical protein ACTPOK_37900 [Streptomyces inhibens]|uniref:hypothetical protein n=1 Tax=Streptomyces inhibens TaxID=2293571 RepID=UPI00402AF77B
MRITDCDRAHLVVSEARAENARQAVAPGQLVEQAMRLMEKAEELVEQAVVAERQRNTSWDQIGQALGGLSKSAAHKRYGVVVNNWLHHSDGTSTEDEDTGEELLGEFASFDMAYTLVERTWAEADEIVHDQDLLNDLRRATLAASGQPGHPEEDLMAVDSGQPRRSIVWASTGSGKTQAMATLLRHLTSEETSPYARMAVTREEHTALEARVRALEQRLAERGNAF